MPKTPFAPLLPLAAALTLLVPAPVALAGPPEGPSGRLVIDEAPQWRDVVAREEREIAKIERGVSRGTHSPLELDCASGRLAEARACLAEAEGRLDAAAGEWRKVIASREREMKWWASHPTAEPPPPAILRGHVAEARCHLAEIERKPATLAAELPKLIAYYDAHLEMIDTLRQAGAYEPETTDEERELRRELRKVCKRLDAVRKQLGPENSAVGRKR